MEDLSVDWGTQECSVTQDLEVQGAKEQRYGCYCTQGCMMSLLAQVTEFHSTDDCVAFDRHCGYKRLVGPQWHVQVQH